jgi:hypothetical protein
MNCMNIPTTVLPTIAAAVVPLAQGTNSALAFPALGQKGREIAGLLTSYDTNKDCKLLWSALWTASTISTFTNAAVQHAALSVELEILSRSTTAIDTNFDETRAHTFVDDVMWPKDFTPPNELLERLAANRKLQERVNRNLDCKRAAQNSRLTASARLKAMVLNRDTEGLSYATNAINRIIRDEAARTGLFGSIGAAQRIVESWGPGPAARHK